MQCKDICGLGLLDFSEEKLNVDVRLNFNIVPVTSISVSGASKNLTVFLKIKHGIKIAIDLSCCAMTSSADLWGQMTVIIVSSYLKTLFFIERLLRQIALCSETTISSFPKKNQKGGKKLKPKL